MTDGLQSAREDLAFLRGLAEEGRNTPLIGGSMLAWAGLIFGLASLVFYAELTRTIDPPGSGLVWLLAIILYAVIGTATVVRLRRQSGSQGTRSKALGSAWSSVGYAIFAIWLAFAAASFRTGEEVIMYMFSPVIMALYGLCWSVAASLSPKTWLKAAAGASFIAAVATAWYAGEPEQFLVYAIALILTTLIPGLMLIREARAAGR
jgi:hypothetical protein